MHEWSNSETRPIAGPLRTENMTLLRLTAYVNGQFLNITASRRGRQVVVISDAASVLARNVHAASMAAAEMVGPMLESAARTGSKWGLHVSLGGVGARFGDFPDENPRTPTLSGPRARPDEPVARIWEQWHRRDGSSLGALEAVMKIIEIYAEHKASRAAA